MHVRLVKNVTSGLRYLLNPFTRLALRLNGEYLALPQSRETDQGLWYQTEPELFECGRRNRPEEDI